MECYLVELKKKEKVRFPSGISTFWTGNDTSTPNLYLQCPQSSWGQGVKPYSESGVGRGRGQKIFDKQPWYTMVCSLGCQIFPAFISQVKFLNLPIWEKIWRFYPDIVVVVQLLSCVWLLVIPWTAACQASLYVTTSWSLLKLMSIESVMPSTYLILCCPLLFLPSFFPSITVF